MKEKRIEVILTAKTLDKLKIKVKRYHYTYDKIRYETIVGETYEEEDLFKVLISRIK